MAVVAACEMPSRHEAVGHEAGEHADRTARAGHAVLAAAVARRDREVAHVGQARQFVERRAGIRDRTPRAARAAVAREMEMFVCAAAMNPVMEPPLLAEPLDWPARRRPPRLRRPGAKSPPRC